MNVPASSPEHLAAPSCDCGEPLARCAGCDQLRCLSCEPYLSDDCRWLRGAGRL